MQYKLKSGNIIVAVIRRPGTIAALSPIKIAPSHGRTAYSGPHLIGLHDSLGQSEPIAQTASRLVQPFYSLTQSVPI